MVTNKSLLERIVFGNSHKIRTLIVSTALAALLLPNTGCYVPNHARERWGFETKNQQNQTEEFINEFGDNTFLKSWAKKYTSGLWEEKGGVRSTSATFYRIAIEVLGAAAECCGKGSKVWKGYQDLRATDIIKDSTKVDFILKSNFGIIDPKLSYSNSIIDGLWKVAEAIRFDRRVYTDPFDIQKIRNNPILELTLAHLEPPNITEINDSLVVIDFPGKDQKYLFVEDGSRGYSLRTNIANILRKRGEADLADRIPGEIPMTMSEANKALESWRCAITVNKLDSLPVVGTVKILPYRSQQAIKNENNFCDSVGVQIIWNALLGKSGLGNNVPSVDLESIVYNLGLKNSKVAEQALNTPYTFNEIDSGIAKISLPQIGIHGFTLGDTSNSSYKIASKLMIPGKGNEGKSKTIVTYVTFPNDVWDKNKSVPDWPMYLLTEDKEYSLTNDFSPGDTVRLQIPITGSFEVPRKNGNKWYSYAIYVSMDSVGSISKDLNAKVEIDPKLTFLQWEDDVSLKDSADATLPSLYKYPRNPTKIAQKQVFSPLSTGFNPFKFEIPWVKKGRYNLCAEVVSYDYSRKTPYTIGRSNLEILVK
ncbi:MAG: hypothetical protein ABIH59_01860 [archaeon]